MASKRSHGVPAPAVHEAGELPRVLSFALSGDERAAVLRVLRRYGPDRSAALLDALGVERAACGRSGSGRLGSSGARGRGG